MAFQAPPPISTIMAISTIATITTAIVQTITMQAETRRSSNTEKKSKSATMTQKQANDVMTPRSVLSERQAHQNPDVIRKNQSESYTPSPLHSPRMAFVTTEFLQNKITATAAGAATHNKQRGRTVKRPPGVDARGQLLQQQQFRAEFGGDERAEEFDDDELYHTMTEYGLYQELGKSNGLYLHNSADDKSKSAKSFHAPRAGSILMVY